MQIYIQNPPKLNRHLYILYYQQIKQTNKKHLISFGEMFAGCSLAPGMLLVVSTLPVEAVYRVTLSLRLYLKVIPLRKRGTVLVLKESSQRGA